MSFDLAEVLKGVSNPDTGREQIEYIPLDLIDKDPNNFYQLNGVEQLADNIATCGLQQPIRVRRHTGEESQGRYIIVSGHRRREALTILVKEDPERWKEVPCIVEHDDVSPALQQLRLIYANANTRTMTSHELSEQVQQVEKLLYQLKEEGYDFPGRMRDHVAKAVNASQTKLARLKMIRDKLAGCWQPDYKKGVLSENTAYELARLKQEDQQLIFDVKKSTKAEIRYLYADSVKEYAKRFAAIRKLKCDKADGIPCRNAAQKREKAVTQDRWCGSPCGKCCSVCSSLASCKKACPHLADQIKQIKADAKLAAQKTKEEKEAKDRPTIEKIQGWWTRFGYVRKQSGLSVDAAYRGMGRQYGAPKTQDVENYEAGSGKITVNTYPPYGYSDTALDELIAAADLFGCSVDYLLGRTDNPYFEKDAEVSESDTWQTGDPVNLGNYAVLARFCQNGSPHLSEMTWDGNTWIDAGMEIDDMGIEVLRWIELPEDCE